MHGRVHASFDLESDNKVLGVEEGYSACSTSSNRGMHNVARFQSVRRSDRVQGYCNEAVIGAA